MDLEWLLTKMLATMVSVLGVKSHRASCCLCGKDRQLCGTMVCGRSAMSSCAEKVRPWCDSMRVLLLSDNNIELHDALKFQTPL
jgi:hypothetical protein